MGHDNLLLDMAQQDLKTLIKPCTVKCLVLYEDLIEANSNLEIRHRRNGVDTFKRPRRPLKKNTKTTKPVTTTTKKYLRVIDERHILHDTKFVDTKHFVDESMVCSLQEFCERAGIKQIPSDPMELCNPFTLLIPDCSVHQDF